MPYRTIISGGGSCFLNASESYLRMYPGSEHDRHVVLTNSLEAAPTSTTVENHPSNSLLNTLSLLKDKVDQVQSLATIIISQDQALQPESTSVAIASIGSILQEIIVAASSIMFTCQQVISSRSNPTDESLLQPNFCGSNHVSNNSHIDQDQRGGQGFESTEMYDWYGDNDYNRVTDVVSTDIKLKRKESDNQNVVIRANDDKSNKNYDIIELDAAYLLAKYTHYCQVCGKGFKRDANLRMHMRAHGDEYKTNAALSNPLKSISNNEETLAADLPRKYSCPQEGCRWNQRHAKFQPLKSMICVKNHYKRSHCPKMYVCKRCNRKQFSVLSDLRTHEKHCGNLKWKCSCGTTFSRKDKLMGHVALFIGHAPAATSFINPEKSGESSNPMQLEDSYGCRG